jgi:hypothetical protein
MTCHAYTALLMATARATRLTHWLQPGVTAYWLCWGRAVPTRYNTSLTYRAPASVWAAVWTRDTSRKANVKSLVRRTGQLEYPCTPLNSGPPSIVGSLQAVIRLGTLQRHTIAIAGEIPHPTPAHLPLCRQSNTVARK